MRVLGSGRIGMAGVALHVDLYLIEVCPWRSYGMLVPFDM